MAEVSVILIAAGGAAEVRRAVESVQAQPGDGHELLVVGDPASAELGASLDGVADGYRVVAAEGSPAAARNAAVAAASGRFLVLVEPGEWRAREALPRHRATLDEDPGVVASYGRTAVHDGERVRIRPEQGRGGDVLSRLVKDKHLVAASACLMWRREALGEEPFSDYATPAALRLALAVRLAEAGGFAFHPAITAEREVEHLDLTGLEELVKVFLGILYGPEPLEEKIEQRARFRLARHLVAIGKLHYRAGDFRKAGNFFDEAVKAAPAYFKGRRYQFLNFVKRKVRG